jgi:molecular chaperone GrpE
MDERRGNGETTGAPGSGPEESDARAEAPGAREGTASETAESLRAEVVRLTQEAERNWQQFLRAAADLENYRKQAIRQREEAVASTRRTMLGVILGVVDTLERALQHTDNGIGNQAGGGAAVAIADGIRLAHRQVLDVLRTMGLRPMETVGQPFDPRVHEAVDAVAATGSTAPGIIVGEVQRGYLIGDEVLRPARVRVAQ